MASIKIVRRKNKQRKDGTAPLALRISKDYKTNYQFLGVYVLEREWDAERGKVRILYPNSKRLNNFLLKKLTEAQDIVFATNDKSTSKEVKDQVKGKSQQQQSFFQLAAERIETKYQKGTFSVAKLELSALHNIEEFVNLPKSRPRKKVIEDIKLRRKERVSQALKSKDFFFEDVGHFKKSSSLLFRDVTPTFLDKYKSFCENYLNQKPRTIANQLTIIRTLFNLAIKNGIIDAKHYPFVGHNEKIRFTASHKIGLTREEIERIEALELKKDTHIWHAKNVWLTAFYFAGIRISDVLKLKWSDFIDDRLFYVMNKNDKPVSLKVPEKVIPIISAYGQEKIVNSDYVFPFLKKADPNDPKDIFTKTRSANWLLNKYLKQIAKQCEIDKNLSMHIARHSFGNIAGDAIHPLMLQKLYRHSDLKTTINYQANFIHREADEALDKVINF